MSRQKAIHQEIESYLQAVASELSEMTAQEKADLLEDLRSQIHDSFPSGDPQRASLEEVREVLASMDSPERYGREAAGQCRQPWQAKMPSGGPRRLGRRAGLLAGAALLIAATGWGLAVLGRSRDLDKPESDPIRYEIPASFKQGRTYRIQSADFVRLPEGPGSGPWGRVQLLVENVLPTHEGGRDLDVRIERISGSLMSEADVREHFNDLGLAMSFGCTLSKSGSLESVTPHAQDSQALEPDLLRQAQDLDASTHFAHLSRYCCEVFAFAPTGKVGIGDCWTAEADRFSLIYVLAVPVSGKVVCTLEEVAHDESGRPCGIVAVRMEPTVAGAIDDHGNRLAGQMELQGRLVYDLTSGDLTESKILLKIDLDKEGSLEIERHLSCREIQSPLTLRPM